MHSNENSGRKQHSLNLREHWTVRFERSFCSISLEESTLTNKGWHVVWWCKKTVAFSSKLSLYTIEMQIRPEIYCLQLIKRVYSHEIKVMVYSKFAVIPEKIVNMINPHLFNLKMCYVYAMDNCFCGTFSLPFIHFQSAFNGLFMA